MMYIHSGVCVAPNSSFPSNTSFQKVGRETMGWRERLSNTWRRMKEMWRDEGGREAGRKRRREREGGMEGEKEGTTEEGRERWREGGREGGREGEREGGREGGREGRKKRGTEGGACSMCITSG